jgi:hypothetical protein
MEVVLSAGEAGMGEYDRPLLDGSGEKDETWRRMANSSVELVSLTRLLRSVECVPPYVLMTLDNCTTVWRE